MKNRFLKLHACLIVLLILFQNCKKEETEKALFAGKYDSTCIYKEYSPPLEITLNHNSDIQTDSDSIDVDMDGNYDITFIYSKTSPFNTSTNFKLLSRNGFVAVAKKLSIPEGMGNYYDINVIDTLAANNSVKMHSYWLNDAYFWIAAPFNYTSGPWLNLSKYYYIGIRRIKQGEEDKFGWICVDATSYGYIQILSYAFEK